MSNNEKEKKKNVKIEKMKQEIDRHLMRVQMQGTKLGRLFLFSLLALFLSVVTFGSFVTGDRVMKLYGFVMHLMFLYYGGLVGFSLFVYLKQKYFKNV